MYLLIVTYTKSQAEVSPHTETHGAWVKKYFDEGVFLAAGPKKDKNGGVIIAKSLDQHELKKIINEDSFVQANVAEYTIIDMDCKLVINELEILKNI